MSATISVGGQTVAAFEVPAGEAEQPSEQCAWLRTRVNDALTAELAKQQQAQPQPEGAEEHSDASGSTDFDDKS